MSDKQDILKKLDQERAAAQLKRLSDLKKAQTEKDKSRQGRRRDRRGVVRGGLPKRLKVTT